jgi:hypothetical protein
VTDPEAVTHNAHERFVAVEDRLLQMPRFMAALEDWTKAPAVTVSLGCDHNWRPFLIPANEDFGADITDGWSGLFGTDDGPDVDAIAQQRVRLKCSGHGCSYDGVKSQAHLLGQYAVALQTNKRSIRLTD